MTYENVGDDNFVNTDPFVEILDDIAWLKNLDTFSINFEELNHFLCWDISIQVTEKFLNYI